MPVVRIVAMPDDTADRGGAIEAAFAEAGVVPATDDQVLVIPQIGVGEGRPRLVHEFTVDAALPPPEEDGGAGQA